MFGYFNNPIRLSNLNFIKWIKIKKNKIQILKYISLYGGLSGQLWLSQNKKIFLQNNTEKFMELYLPRFSYELWLQDNFIKNYNKIKLLKKNNIYLNIKFFNGKVIKLSQSKNFITIKTDQINANLIKFNLKKLKKITFKEKMIVKKNDLLINTKTLTIGLGIPSSSSFYSGNAKNYINDFYFSGSTSNLIKKIKTKNNKILFIGSMAGFLEPMQELYLKLKKKEIEFEITAIGSKKTLIEKANLSKNYKKYRLNCFTKKKILTIKNASAIFHIIKKEFKFAIQNNFLKYDAWTKILNQKLLIFAYNNLSLDQKKKYNSDIFYRIRKITRFTNPIFVEAKERLFEMKKINIIKNKVKKIVHLNNFFKVIFVNPEKKVFNNKFDLVINVSGPKKITDDENLLSSDIIKKNFFKNSVKTTKKYELFNNKNIFIPGVISNNFNPDRKTIINAIDRNCSIAANQIVNII